MIITNKPCLFDLNCDNAMLRIMNNAILCEYDPTNGQSAKVIIFLLIFLNKKSNKVSQFGRNVTFNYIWNNKKTNNYLSVIYWSPRAKEPKKENVISKRNKQNNKKKNK